MRKNKTLIKMTIALLFVANSAYGGAGGYVSNSAALARKMFQQNIKTASTKENGAKSVTGPMGTGTTINQGSYTGQNSQSAGSAANAAAGAALIASGTALLPPPTTPTGAMLIALGMLAMMQSGHDSDAAGKSGLTAAASDYQNKTPQPYATGEAGFNDPKTKAAAAKIAEMGFKVTEAGITKPDGTFVPASALSSPSAMKAAGVDANAVKEVQQINTALADELSKYNAKISGVAASGGGGGGGAANDVGPGGEEASASFNPFSMSADAKAKLMAGKTVNLDGEPIGVAGANIFEMVHEAYQKKRSGSQFFENEEPNLRAPASAPRK